MVRSDGAYKSVTEAVRSREISQIQEKILLIIIK